MVNLNKISCDPVYSAMLSALETGFRPESVLCSAIKNSQGNVIGIVQLVNKPDVGFTKADEHFMEAFVIFCGLGITNTNMYEESVALSNKQKIAVEVRVTRLIADSRNFFGQSYWFRQLMISVMSISIYLIKN